MLMYAEQPLQRSRQVTADLAVIAWTVLWVLLARAVHGAVLVLAEPGIAVSNLGRSISDTMGEAAGVVVDVPLVGDGLAAPFQALGDSGSGVTGAGQDLQDAVGTLALVLAVVLVVLPVGWALFRWFPWRLGWAREAQAARRLRAELDLELLAARAVGSAPLPALAGLPTGTGAAWRDRDPVATRALAQLELRRLGLRMPSAGDVSAVGARGGSEPGVDRP